MSSLVVLTVWIGVWGYLTAHQGDSGLGWIGLWMIAFASLGAISGLAASTAGVEHRAYSWLLMLSGGGHAALILLPFTYRWEELGVFTFVWACGSLIGAMLTAKRKIGNYCLRCGYSTDGLTASTCPECGATVKSADADTTA